MKRLGLLTRYILLLAFLMPSLAQAQYYNKEVKAEILVEKTSEFYTFIASAENITPSDYSLRYDFMVFRRDENGNIAKSNQENRFFLGGNQKELLAQTTVNFNEEGNIVIVLLIYDLNDKPIGQDRIELADGGRTEIELLPAAAEDVANQDQAAPADGFVLEGLVLEKTITKIGRDFYRYFWQDWNLREIRTNKNILIEEVPARGRATRLSVKVEDRLVWQFFGQPKKDFLVEMAQISMQRVIRELQRLQQQQEELVRY